MLEKLEIAALADCLSKTFLFITKLKEQKPIARHVQYPKIPPKFSESLAAHAIIDGLIFQNSTKISNVKLGGAADIIATTDHGNEITIEIKASGPQEFATFGEKDYDCDILLWLLFGEQFMLGNLKTVEVLLCKKPAKHLPWRKARVTKKQLVSSWQGNLQKITIDL